MKEIFDFMVNEQTIYSYKNGFSEGVVFAFYQEGKILIEHRPNESIIDGEYAK